MMLSQVQEYHLGTVIGGCLNELPCDTAVTCAEDSNTDWTDFTDCVGVTEHDVASFIASVRAAINNGGNITGLEPCNQTVDLADYDCNWFRRLGDQSVAAQIISCDPSFDSQGYECAWYVDSTLDQCGSHDTECFDAVEDCDACTTWSAAQCNPTVDEHNSPCSYYATYPEVCGDHDTDCFHAFTDCDECTCNPDIDDMGDDCDYYEGNVDMCG